MITDNRALPNQQLLIKPVTAISQTAARWSFATAIISLVIVAILHIIKPEIEPRGICLANMQLEIIVG